MAHEPRLMRELRALLQGHRVAALGTLGADGKPQVSMVPFAMDAQHGCLVLHVSGLAAHTRNLDAAAGVSLMVMQAEAVDAPVHALPRVSLDCSARTLERDSAPWHSARAAYLARFPEAEPMTQLGDFRFVALQPVAARHVAGFGAARSIDIEELQAVLRATV